jgi:GT2 family glycosyltransferase
MIRPLAQSNSERSATIAIKPPMPKNPISVVILGYLRFEETTRRCLASLADDPEFTQWDLIVIDSGTDPQTQAKYVQAAAQYPTLKLMRLEQNTGVPGGLNAGLHAALGDPIILVSSDVLIPAGMISRLAAAFEEHPNAGLVAPVTNNAGTEQKIFIESTGDAIGQGLAFAQAAPDGGVSAYRLDFCCVGLRRAVYEAIGGFDVAFSPGYYEDFDYSLRAKEAGFDLMIAENVFIYHEGGGSFRASPEKTALIARNKRLFLDKHGPDTWLPHQRDGNLAALRQYADQAQAGHPPSAYRIANRLRLAASDLPKGPLKRWRFRRKAAAIEQRLKVARG